MIKVFIAANHIGFVWLIFFLHNACGGYCVCCPNNRSWQPNFCFLLSNCYGVGRLIVLLFVHSFLWWFGGPKRTPKSVRCGKIQQLPQRTQNAQKKTQVSINWDVMPSRFALFAVFFVANGFYCMRADTRAWSEKIQTFLSLCLCVSLLLVFVEISISYFFRNFHRIVSGMDTEQTQTISTTVFFFLFYLKKKYVTLNLIWARVAIDHGKRVWRNETNNEWKPDEKRHNGEI